MLSKSEVGDFLRDMPVAFVVFRVLPSDIVYAYVNEAGACIEGFRREELVGKSMPQVFPAVDAATMAAVRMTAEQGVKQYFTRCIPGSRYLSIQTYQPRPGFCACVLHDVTDTARQDNLRKEEHQRLELQATRDPLTGLFNVREGRVLVERQLAEPRWKGTRGALFMFDLDDFKLVNDHYGHLSGDSVLAGVAQHLRRAFGENDLICRWGGDEFVVYCERTTRDDMAARMHVLCDGPWKTTLEDQREISLSVSIGIAMAPQDGTTFKTVYERADRALYQAKSKGKAHFCFYEANPRV